MVPLFLGVAGGPHHQRQAVVYGIVYGGASGGVKGEIQHCALDIRNLGKAGIDALTAFGIHQSGDFAAGVMRLQQAAKLQPPLRLRRRL